MRKLWQIRISRPTIPIKILILDCIMIRLTIFSLFLLLLSLNLRIAAQPESQDALYRYIENPALNAEGQTLAHVPIIPYSGVAEALEGNTAYSHWYQSLDGPWKFKWSNTPEERTRGFESADFSGESWDDIQVPGTWQMQGHGYNVYRNIPLEFGPYDPPRVPRHMNPTGTYIRYFELPPSWSGRRILLNFEGVQSAHWVWINGRYAGFGKDSMTSNEYDITDFLKPGRNKVAVMVVRWSDGSYLEDIDAWRFSGIYRSVYLTARSEVYLRDLFITTALDQAYRDARLQLRCHIQVAEGLSAEGYSIRATLFDRTGQSAAVLEQPINRKNPMKGDGLTLSRNIADPLKWSAEKPNLYNLLVEWLGPDGAVLETVKQQVGFRQYEIKHGVILVNGVPVKLKGVNRHEHHPRTGRTVSRDDIVEDMILMKRLNVNAIRNSHYPNTPLFYELANEFGFYVCDEVNNECHYGENIIPHQPGWDNAFLHRTERMFQRDKNHPCIMMWSTGNECGYGPVHHLMADYLRREDPTRFIYHQGNEPNGDAPYADICGIRYPSPERLRVVADTSRRPVVMGEYMHSMGNSLGQFDEYWETIYSADNLQGGFTWDWVDQGLYSDLFNTPDRSAYNHQAVLMGRPVLVPGKTGQGLQCSGVDDWIEVYAHPVFNRASTGLTAEAWVFPRGYYGENSVLSKSGQFELTQDHRDSLRFSIHTGQWQVVAAFLPRDWNFNWHHVAGVYDGANIRIVVDGVVLAEKPAGGHLSRSRHPVCIGKNHLRHDEQFPGFLSNLIYDEVRLSHRALKLNELGYQRSEPPLNSGLVLWLPLDERQHNGSFLSYGATPTGSGTMDGCINADRSMQPEAWQLKKSHQPVRVRALSLEEGRFRIENRHHFTDLNQLECRWSLWEDDRIAHQDILDLQLAPGEAADIRIPYAATTDVASHTSVRMVVSFHQRNESPWAEAGYEVAFDEFEWPWKAGSSSAPQKAPGAVHVAEGHETIHIRAGESEYQIDRSSGMLTGIRFRGKDLIYSAPALNVWRTPINNETSTWGVAEAEYWYKYGLDSLVHRLRYLRTEESASGQTRIFCGILSTSHNHPDIGFVQDFTYRFFADGELALEHRISCQTEPPPFSYEKFPLEFIQKLGLQMRLAAGFDAMHWFGRGPFENYPDRKSAARLGRYRVPVDSIEMPYILPQDFGNLCDVRWAAVTRPDGIGLALFSVDRPMNLSLDPYANLEQSWYPFQLRRSANPRLNFDVSVTGVGGTPVSVRHQYRTFPSEYHYTIRIRPVELPHDDLFQLFKSNPF